jgi:hypothetical protein
MRTSNRIRLPAALAAALLCLLGLPIARAGGSTPLLSPAEPLNSPDSFPPGTNVMYGRTFQLLQPVVATGAGWYDQGQDGLVNSHDIGVWQGSYDNYTTLASSVAVPAGTRVPLDGDWRETDLTVAEFGPMLFVEPIPEPSPSVVFGLSLCSWLAVRASRRCFARAKARDAAGQVPDGCTTSRSQCATTLPTSARSPSSDMHPTGA